MAGGFGKRRIRCDEKLLRAEKALRVGAVKSDLWGHVRERGRVNRIRMHIISQDRSVTCR